MLDFNVLSVFFRCEASERLAKSELVSLAVAADVSLVALVDGPLELFSLSLLLLEKKSVIFFDIFFSQFNKKFPSNLQMRFQLEGSLIIIHHEANKDFFIVETLHKHGVAFKASCIKPGILNFIAI